jgi:hypothetical protein
MSDWTHKVRWARWFVQGGVIVTGTGAFGAALGAWNSPEQAMFTAIKLPVIVLLTTLGNGLLNGMLAPLLGMNLGFRQSLAAVWLSCTVMALILGAVSPLLGFLVWNVPPLSIGRRDTTAYEMILLAGVVGIAFAGIVGVGRLFQTLHRLSGNPIAAVRVIMAWLTVNLFLGAQLAWNLRPFIGAPELQVQFLRPNAFEGNFYEAVGKSFLRLFN